MSANGNTPPPKLVTVFGDLELLVIPDGVTRIVLVQVAGRRFELILDPQTLRELGEYLVKSAAL